MLSILLASSLSLTAVVPADFVRILVPVVAPDTVPGAQGSRWKTELWVANLSPQFIPVSQTPAAGDCQLGLCPEELLPGNTETHMAMYSPFWGGGGFLYVERANASDVHMHLVSHDLNHAAEEAGVAIPLVNTEDIVPGTEMALVGITLKQGYRLRVRIFDADGRPSGVRLRVVDSTSSALVYERDLELLIGEQRFADFPTHPGYLAVDLAPEQVPLDSRIRLEIGPHDPETRIWAMATLTNNQTQRVTIFTPQPWPRE